MAGDAQAAARGGTALVVVQAIGKVLGFVFVLVAARRIGPETFGRYAIVASLLVFANFIADFGTSSAVVRLVARDPDSSSAVLRGSSLASLGLGVISGIAFVAFALTANYPVSTRVDVAIGMFAVPGQSLLSSVQGAFDGHGALATRSWLALGQTVIVALGGGLALVITGEIRSSIVAIAIAPWLALGLATHIARRRGFWNGGLGFDRRIVIDLVRLALPFALAGSVVALSLRFDVLLLSLLRGPHETATYELALRLIEGMAIVGTAVAGSATFLLNRRIGAGDIDGARAAYRETAGLLYVVGLLVSAVVFSLAQPIVLLVFGEPYAEVAMPLAVLGAAQWVAFLIQLEGALVNSRDDLARSSLVAAACLSTTLVLDVVLVPLYGVAGAAGAGAVGVGLTALGLDIYHRRTLGVGLPRPPLGGLVAFAVASTAGILLDLPLLVGVVAVAILYAVIAFATRAVTPSMLHRVWSLVIRPR